MEKVGNSTSPPGGGEERVLKSTLEERVQGVTSRHLPRFSCSLGSSREQIDIEEVSLPHIFSQIARFKGDKNKERELNQLCHERAMVHIADKISPGSSYQGWEDQYVCTLFSRFLELFYSQNAFDQTSTPWQLIVKKLDFVATIDRECKEAATKACRYFEQMRLLKPGESILIGSGWKARSASHSIMIEIELVRESVYNIAMYEAGGFQIAPTFCEHQMNFRTTRVRIEGVSIESPLYWIQKILEISSSFSSDTEYDMDDFIELAMRDLLPTDRVELEKEKSYFRCQWGGSCSYRSKIGWLHFQLPKEEYKAFITWMQTQVLLRATQLRWKSYKNSSLSLLHAYAQSLQMHAIGRLRKHKGEIGDRLGYFTQCGIVGLVIAKEIHKSLSIGKVVPHSIDPFVIETLNEKKIAEVLTKNLEELPSLQERPKCSFFSTPPTIELGPPTLENFLHILAVVPSTYIQHDSSIDIESFQYQFSDWVLSLPSIQEMVQEGWMEKIVEKDLSLLEGLRHCSLLLMTHAPSHIMAGMKLLAMLHAADSKISGQGQNVPDIVNILLCDGWGLILDPRLIEEENSLQSYFSSFVTREMFNITREIFGPKHPNPIVKWASQVISDQEEKGETFQKESRIENIKRLLNQRSDEILERSHPAYPSLELIYTYLGWVHFLSGGEIQSTIRPLIALKTESPNVGTVIYCFNEKTIKRFYYNTSFLYPQKETAAQTLIESYPFIRTTTARTQALSDFFCKEGKEDTLTHLERYLAYDQWQLLEQPSAVLDHFFYEMLDLEKDRMCALLLLLLGRSGISDNKKIVFPFSTLLQQESFRHQFSVFIQKALLRFREQTDDDCPHHKVCCMLACIAMIAKEIYFQQTKKDLFKECCMGYVEDYIQTPFSRDTPLVYQRMQKLLQVYNACFVRSISKEQVVEVCKAWCEQKALFMMIHKEEAWEWFTPYVQRRYLQKIESWVDMLDLSDYEQFSVLLPLSIIEEKKETKWQKASSTFIQLVAKDDSLLVTVDLRKGKITTSSGDLFLTEEPKWLFSKPFSLLFPKGYDHIYVEGGTHICFQVGKCCFRVDSSAPLETLAFFYQDQWLSFVNPKKLAQFLPSTLATRFLYFYDRENSIVYGLDREDFSISIFITKEKIQDKRGVQIAPLPENIAERIGGFLSHREIEIEYEEGDIQQIRFPSVEIWSGGELSCFPNGNSWSLTSYPDYSLQTKPDQHRAFGKFCGRLSFKNREGEYIHYLPIAIWKEEESWDLHTDSIWQLDKEREEDSHDLYRPKDKALYLMEYREDREGRVVATSVEGSLYLAMIWLLQKEYELFLRELEGIKGESIGKHAHSLINATLKTIQGGHEHTPEHLACLCHFMFLARDMFSLDDNEEWISLVYKGYLNHFDRIPSYLRLSPLEELTLASFYGILPKWREDMLLGKPLQQTSREYVITYTSSKRPLKLCETKHLLTTELEPSETLDFPLIQPAWRLRRPYLFNKEKFSLLFFAVHCGEEDLGKLAELISASHRKEIEDSEVAIEFLSILQGIYIERLFQCGRLSRGDRINPEIYQNFIRHIEYSSSYMDQSIIKKDVDLFLAEIHRCEYPFASFLKIFEKKVEEKEVESEEALRRVYAISSYKKGDIVVEKEPSFFSKGVSLLSRVALNIPFQPLISKGLSAYLPFKKSTQIAPLPFLSISSQELHLAFMKEWEDLQRDLHYAREHRLPLLSMQEQEIEEKIGAQLIRALRDKPRIDELEKTILARLNKISEGDMATYLEREGGLQKHLTIEDAIYLFLRGNRSLFKEMNPYLEEEEILSLMVEIEEYLFLQTERQHRERIQDLEAKYRQFEGSIEANYYRARLIEALTAKREYTISAQTKYFLVCEYVANIRLRPQQVANIEYLLNRKGEVYTDGVVQMLMGEGKTTVLATVLLAMVADTGGIGIFVVPASLFPTIKKTLSDSLRKAFHKTLYSLELSKEDLSDKYTMRFTLQLLQNIEKEGSVLITTPEILQMIELEFLYQYQYIDKEGCIEELAAILQILRTAGHALFDEVHLLLETTKEVNFPTGISKSVDKKDIETIQEIYELLISPHIGEGEGASLQEKIRLLKNEQGQLSEEMFYEEVLPLVAKELASRYVEFCFFTIQELEEFFGKRVISNAVLLRSLQTLRSSSDLSDREFVHKIALAKHVLWDLLPHTLTKSCDRSYGRLPGNKKGKVVPYQAVDTPSNSEFGYYLEAISYHIATVLQRGIEPEQIQHMAHVFRKLAKHIAEEKKISIKETPLAKQFFAITGLHLHEARERKRCEKVVERLEEMRRRGEVKTLLEIEKFTILENVIYYSHHLSSNAHALSTLCSSLRAFSGTPWNIDTYKDSLRSRYISQEGVIGSVLSHLLDRDTKSPHVHPVSSVSAVNMLQIVMEQVSSEQKISMLLDPAGLFKDQNMIDIAKEVRDFLRDEELPFKGVLFFTYPKQEAKDLLESEKADFKENEIKTKEPDQLAFLSLYNEAILYPQGSSIEALKRIGLSPGEYFVICGERHTTGVNFAMAPNAVAVMTMDLVSAATATQAMMRLRQYQYTQDVHIVIPEKVLQHYQLPANAFSVIQLMTLAGAKQKYSNMPRALYQKVNHITRQFAKELLLDSVLNRQSSEELLNLQRALEPFIFTAISDDPFLLLEVEEAAPAAFAEILMSHYLSRKTDFLSVLRKFGIEEEPFKQKFALFERSIQKEIRESPFIPKTMNNTFAMYLNTSMQVTIQQESQVEMTQEKEIMQELQVLQKETLAPIPTECKWEEGDAFTFLKDIRERSDFSIRKNGGHLFITPLFRASICPFVSKFPFMKKFVSLFSSDILATNNFLQCEHEGSLAPSLFHRRFFPIVHLLLIDCGEETYKIVCITPTEASFWREFLNTHIQCGVWMINLEGQTIADFRRQEVLIEGTQTMRMIPAPAKENVIHLLIQVNALMGHIRFLNRYPKETTKWMQGQFEEAHTFLKYALLSQKVQEETEIFLRTPLFHSPSD